ncbi:MAG TPA: hypothetical protein VNW46_10535 [Gemmatimonadaceae bacterium]|jgi:hypothetical protein|nr:hypothetical protein [Gemmatimonadaceae bacterium]
MPTRSLTIEGQTWRVFPAGRITQYDHDEFALLFVHGSGDAREVRVTRYSPQGTRSREQSFAELSGDDLRRLFDVSQPGATSPEARYAN